MIVFRYNINLIYLFCAGLICWWCNIFFLFPTPISHPSPFWWTNDRVHFTPFKVSQETVHVRYGQKEKKIDGSDWSFWTTGVHLFGCWIFFFLGPVLFCPCFQVKRFGRMPDWLWLLVVASKRNSFFLHCFSGLLNRMERSIPRGEKRVKDLTLFEFHFLFDRISRSTPPWFNQWGRD